MIPDPQCRCCGTKDVKYVHEITQLGPIPVTINVYYCENCARLVDQFEQWVFRTQKRLLK